MSTAITILRTAAEVTGYLTWAGMAGVVTLLWLSFSYNRRPAG